MSRKPLPPRCFGKLRLFTLSQPECTRNNRYILKTTSLEPTTESNDLTCYQEDPDFPSNTCSFFCYPFVEFRISQFRRMFPMKIMLRFYNEIWVCCILKLWKETGSSINATEDNNHHLEFLENDFVLFDHMLKF